jgi:hypothetical protein
VPGSPGGNSGWQIAVLLSEEEAQDLSIHLYFMAFLLKPRETDPRGKFRGITRELALSAGHTERFLDMLATPAARTSLENKWHDSPRPAHEATLEYFTDNSESVEIRIADIVDMNRIVMQQTWLDFSASLETNVDMMDLDDPTGLTITIKLHNAYAYRAVGAFRDMVEVASQRIQGADAKATQGISWMRDRIASVACQYFAPEAPVDARSSTLGYTITRNDTNEKIVYSNAEDEPSVSSVARAILFPTNHLLSHNFLQAIMTIPGKSTWELILHYPEITVKVVGLPWELQVILLALDAGCKKPNDRRLERRCADSLEVWIENAP